MATNVMMPQKQPQQTYNPFDPATYGQGAYGIFTSGAAKNAPNPWEAQMPDIGAPMQEATNYIKSYTGGLQDLWNKSNYGRNLFSQYDVDLRDPNLWQQMRTGSQMYSDMSRPEILGLARQLSNVGRQRGGYGTVGGGGDMATMLGGLYQGRAAQGSSNLQNLYQNIVANRENARRGAQTGFQGLLGGLGSAMGTYGSAASGLADAYYKMNMINQMEKDRMAKAYAEMASSNQLKDPMQLLLMDPNLLPAGMQDMYRQARALYTQPLRQEQAQANARAKLAQDFQRLQQLMGMGALQGNRLTDAGRGQEFSLQKQLEQALIGLGVASPVQRKQDMNQILGYGAGGGTPQSMPLNIATGLGSAWGKYGTF